MNRDDEGEPLFLDPSHDGLQFTIRETNIINLSVSAAAND
jgi:hypothetical protein